MIATEITKNPHSNVIHGLWGEKQTLLCIVGKKYGWGTGLSPYRPYDELFPEGPKMLRVNAQNAKRYEHELKTGEYWLINATGWHLKEGDEDKGRQIIHVEGNLKRKATETEVKEEKLHIELAEAERQHERRRCGPERYALEISTKDTVWKASRELKGKEDGVVYGMGYVLESNKAVFDEVLPEKEKNFRLEVKNPRDHSPKVGEFWKVEVVGLHYTEDDVDPKGKQVIYVEGELKEKVVSPVCEPKKEFVRKPRVVPVSAREHDMAKPVFEHARHYTKREEPEDEYSAKEKRRQKVKKSFQRGESHDSTWRKKITNLGIDPLDLKVFKQNKREYRDSENDE
jgi:hypothetical protein